MKDKKILIIIGIIAFIMIIGGVSYSYFVYNKDIGTVSLSTGEISINYSNVNGSLSLSNIVPKSGFEGMNSGDYVDFTVNATVDTEKIYYEVYILPNGDNTLNTAYLKTYLTDQSDVRISNVKIYDNLANAEKAGGKVIYRGIVETNVDGSSKNFTKDFRLRIWLDDNYSEVSSKTFDFDIYLYAYNVDDDFTLPKTLEEIMTQSAVMDNINSTYVTNSTPGINFGEVSSDTNGKGVYMRAGTESDTYPIMYYRGAVEDNNVFFNNLCWKAVRTTDTGGVKLIYNGEFYDSYTYVSENGQDIFTYDNTDSTWNYEVNDGQNHEISFKVPAGDNYKIVITGTTGSSCGLAFEVLKDGTSVYGGGGGGGRAINFNYSYGTLTSSNVLKVSIYDASSTS